MKKAKLPLVAMLLTILVLSLGLTGFSKANPLLQYYIDVTQKVKIQDVFKESAAKYKVAAVEIANAEKAKTKVDMKIVEKSINSSLSILKDGKARALAMKITDSKAKKYHSYLLLSLDDQIGAYTDMLKGIKTNNNTLIQSGLDKMDKSSKDIDEWSKGNVSK